MTSKSEFNFNRAPIVGGDIRFCIEPKDWDIDGDRTHSFALYGWCASVTGKPIEIEFYLEGTRIAATPLKIERPDVVERLKRPEVLHSGYHLRLSKYLIPRDAIVDVRLREMRADGTLASVTLGTITGLSAAHEGSRYREKHQPLLLTGMGRSGGSLLMQLLASHPAVLVPGSHPYEMRQPVWLWQAAQVLSAPASPTSIGPDGFEALEPERLGFNPYRSREWEQGALSADAVSWQEQSLPLACVDFCKQQVDQFVDACARGRAVAPRYIAQKILLSSLRFYVRNIYAGAREILLVRDFRDVWLSARSFNRQRGSQGFGRDQCADDLAWLRGLAHTTNQIREAHRADSVRRVLVRYEDLMRDPYQTLKSLFDALQIDASRERLRAIIATVSGDASPHRTAASQRLSGRWRSEMTAYELAVAAEAFGEDLRYFGYDV